MTKKEQELDRVEELHELKWVLSSKLGRRFLWRQLEKAGVFSSTFSRDALVMSLNEGRRSMGNELLSDINEAHVEAFFNMMRENREPKKKENDEPESESESAEPAAE